MLSEFKKHITNNFANLVEDRFLLACSGGLDSIVLAHLCTRLNLDFHLAHCNFRLRGEASDGDEQFVKKTASDLHKYFHVTHFDTVGYMNKNSVNVQVAARELRYAWFAELMLDNQIPTLVTAHHADDNLETFLINLSRGTGIDGVTGIPEKTATISRPLLPFSRKQILEFATSENLKWREDSSNSDLKYLRNKIRHELVPVMKELHPTFLDNFKNTLSNLSDTALIFDNHVKELATKLFEPTTEGFRILISELEVLNPQKSYVRALFKAYGFTAYNDIIQLLHGLSGKEVHSKTHRLIRDRDYLLLTELKPKLNDEFLILDDDQQIMAPVDMQIKAVKTIKNSGAHVWYCDKDALKYPLFVRKWEKGDYFYPFGMNGKKKISKYFKDEKMDVLSKEKQWLLCSGNEIIWVIGKRGDRRFAVTDQTKEIIKFEITS